MQHLLRHGPIAREEHCDQGEERKQDTDGRHAREAADAAILALHDQHRRIVVAAARARVLDQVDAAS